MPATGCLNNIAGPISAIAKPSHSLPARWFVLALLLAPLAAVAQSLITVTPQQCVWRAGDNPAWAAPGLDESGWQPYSTWKLDPSESRIWVRCHLEPAALGDLDHPALQVRMLSAYEVFLNGVSIGTNGDLHSGLFSEDSIRIFPFSPPLAGDRSNVLALRVVYRFATESWESMQSMRAAEIQVGGMESLRNNRASVLVSLIRQSATTFIPMVMIGIIGLVLLEFSVSDRSHPELILLGLACVFVGLMFVNILCGSVMTDEPAWANLAFYSLTCTANLLAQMCFYFALARKRIPALFKLLIAAWLVRAAWPLVELLLPPERALPLDTILSFIVVPIGCLLLAVLLGFGPFIAFWPYNRIPRRMRAAAGLSATWGAILIVFFLTLCVALIPNQPDFFQKWQSALFPAQSIVQVCVVVALIAIVVREQRQIAVQRSILAGEMEAAQKMQRALIPASIESLSGFKIDIAFKPAREVGGDFYSCRILGAGRQRILLGDVSGKGAAAAMTAAVLLGAAERREKDSPLELLRHLNLVMSDMRLGGFATCVCADIAPNGTATFANAGHLAPYRNGEEIDLGSGLPLGILADAGYSEASVQLQPSDMITLLSDGVVEARNNTGELFGFDRTRQISTQSAEEIARAASTFGQEDDITVLTISFSSAAVAHA